MMTVDPALLRRPPGLDPAVVPGSAGRPVPEFLRDVAPGRVREALRRCLPRTAVPPESTLHLVRAKLKPGRKLTAEYAVVLPAAGLERRIWVAWVAPGVRPPGPAPAAEAEARRRGVLAPFVSSWAASDDGRMTVSVAPVDAAFPQLVRLYDRTHVAALLRSVRGLRAVATDEVAVHAVRYRPGQRHVVRVDLAARDRAFFAKVYRDDTGRRTVAAAARAASAFAAAGARGRGLGAATGTYVPDEQVALWDEVRGTALSALLPSTDSVALSAVRSVGVALRVLHDSASADGLPACPDAAAQAGETLRTAQVVEAFAPAAGALVRTTVAAALDRLSALPTEPATFTHGDAKCDNLVVGRTHLHLLDFDRAGRGDPAADVGKFLADLRWSAPGDQRSARLLQDAFLDGYGPASPARLARARVYDTLLQLRLAARRSPIQEPDWADQVSAAVGVAAAALEEPAWT